MFTGGHSYYSKVPIPENPSTVVDTRPYQFPRKIYGQESQAVEASAYALMVMLEKNDKEASESIMMWLQTMRNSIGGFSGTRVSKCYFSLLLKILKRHFFRLIYFIHWIISTTGSNRAYVQIVFLYLQKYKQWLKISIYFNNATITQVLFPQYFLEILVKIFN